MNKAVQDIAAALRLFHVDIFPVEALAEVQAKTRAEAETNTIEAEEKIDEEAVAAVAVFDLKLKLSSNRPTSRGRGTWMHL
jgi:hypothetical protein